MFDYTTTQHEVTALLAEMGFKATLEKFGGSKAKAYAVWGKSEASEVPSQISVTTGEQKVMYLAANIKKTPAVGDNIVLGAATWSVDKVEVYMPASVILAYRLTVTS